MRRKSYSRIVVPNPHASRKAGPSHTSRKLSKQAVVNYKQKLERRGGSKKKTALRETSPRTE